MNLIAAKAMVEKITQQRKLFRTLVVAQKSTRRVWKAEARNAVFGAIHDALIKYRRVCAGSLSMIKLLLLMAF